MRVLFVSGELIAGNVACFLQREGCEVKLFIEHPRLQCALDGFLEKTDDWKSELSWVGKDGLIIFDDVGYGKDQDELRRNGYRVVGGSEGGDRLELDREYGQAILAQCGIRIIPTHNFSDADEAISFISNRPGKWVVKQNNHQSSLNYVGMLESGQDVVSVLRLYRRHGIRNITLQEKVDGIEVSINRYFNGSDWVGPSEITIEHKSLCNDNLGPKTGEMGNLMWYDDGESRFFKETLGKLKAYLQKTDFRGDIDINCFINEGTVVPIEVTSRFGCPITHSQSVMHLSPWNEFLSAVADGRQYSLKHRKGYCIALSLLVPPFPYEPYSSKEGFLSEGLEIFFKNGSIETDREHFHLESVTKDIIDGVDRYFISNGLGCVMYVTGYGKNVRTARKAVYKRAESVVIPKMFYRTDIATSFMNSDMDVLKKWGWIA